MKILGEFTVNLQLTENAKRYISELIDRSEITNPIVGIRWARWNDEAEDRWMLALHDRDRCSGWLCRAPGLEFVIVNPQLIERLEGRILDVLDANPTIH